MNQTTHAWIAIRAIKLLEDEGSVPDLVRLLLPFIQEASIGAWIPDKRDAKLGSGQTQNHVFKIGPYKAEDPVALKSRFVVDKKKTLKLIGPERLTAGFLDKYSNILDANWWNESYKADPPPGKHLANRAMALGINNIDLLILGDPNVQSHVPGRVDFIGKMSDDTKTKPGQAALFFFMLSHFIADSLMPCHCDERDLSDYGNGLHEELESHWGALIGDSFTEKNLFNSTLNDREILNNATKVDSKFGYSFRNIIPKPQSKDIWDEVVILCRASFAVASIIAPYNVYKYKPAVQTLAKFDDLFTRDQYGKDLLSEFDKVIIHDAVLNVAMIWKDIWLKFN
jgi:hypothetical protein